MTHPTDALRLVPIEPTFEMLDAGAAVLSGGKEALDYEVSNAASVYEAMTSAAPASPLPEGGGQLSKNLGQLKSGQCSGISGELDPRLVEWGYTSLDEAITHLGKLLDNQTAFDGLAAPTGAK